MGRGRAMIVPNIGDRVERTIGGVSKRGFVHYADELQALVKWDDGSSSSLRLDREKLRIIEASPTPSHAVRTPVPEQDESVAA
jgi:hypothetical protein